MFTRGALLYAVIIKFDNPRFRRGPWEISKYDENLGRKCPNAGTSPSASGPVYVDKSRSLILDSSKNRGRGMIAGRGRQVWDVWDAARPGRQNVRALDGYRP